MSASHWITLHLVPVLGARLIQWLGHSLDVRKRGEDSVHELYREGKSVIFAFWHGRQCMMPLVYRGKLAYILISQHRDGELIHRIVSRLGFRSVRGSTTRGGSAAFRQLVRHGRSGADLVVTPDGPKGPKWKVQEGVIHLAKLTGQPIVPVTVAYSKKNFSPVGTSLWSPIHWGRLCLFGGLLCGLMRPLLARRLRASVLNWNAHWSRSLSKPMQNFLNNRAWYALAR
ncbi:lysophospholipid acyltransferase family protein [Nitrospira sp. M1]